MGLAASQARLLNLTRRMHDIEYKAQNLEAQKLQMANESQAVYQEYENALNRQKVQFRQINADGAAIYEDANIATLLDAGYKVKVLNGSEWSTFNSYDGKVLAEEVPAPTKKDGPPIDPSWTMKGFPTASLCSIRWVGSADDTQGGYYFVTGVDETGLNVTDGFLVDGDSNVNASGNPIAEIVAKPDEIVEYNGNLYQVDSVCDGEQGRPSKMDENGNYYVYKWFKLDSTYKFKAKGELADIDVTNKETLRNLLEAGFIVFEKPMGDGTFEEVNIATDTNLQEVSDETELKKAEAKYESDMRKINQKDKKFDTDLAALEAERNAIKTEIETLKSIAKDNVDRTYKLFS